MRHFSSLFWLVVLCISVAALVPGCARPEPVDLVLRNGKIVTVDAERPSAQAIAVKGDTIVALGTDRQIDKYVGDATRVIDLGGKLAVPGLIDSHVHFMGIGETKLQLDLTKAKNWDDIVAMVAEAAKTTPPGQPIRGRGWHQEKWDKLPTPSVEGFPLHAELSKVSPHHPVYLEHASGHATIANARAMELAGITSKTRDPEGGTILRDGRGNPIGVFTENAEGMLRSQSAAPALTAEQQEAHARRVIELAAQECLSKGITSVHDAGVGFPTIDLFKKVAAEGKLGVRVYVMVSGTNAELEARLPTYKTVAPADKHVTVRAVKRLIDGALGSRTAWLLEPYADLATSTGVETMPVAELAETARIALANGFQLCTHAIGDRANRETLNVYESAFRTPPPKEDLRWRIEHAQHISAADIPRLGKLGIVASMQGIHATSDAPYVLARLGAHRAEEGAYVWQKLMKTGAVIANGTDAPVEPVDTMPGFHALVARTMKDGQPFYAEQKMNREDALRAYTLNGAYSAFEEKIKGSLTPGKLADITVLSRDIMTIPEDQIASTEVLYTIVGGKVLYKK